MNAANYALYVVTFVGLAVLMKFGSRPERIAVALILLTILAEPFAQGITLNTWRIGTGGLNLLLLAGLWIMAEKWDRWWLVLASSLQLIVVLTHLMPVMESEFGVNTGVTIRLIMWALIVVSMFMGAWEASAERYWSAVKGPRPAAP
jgi:hypothetical protein